MTSSKKQYQPITWLEVAKDYNVSELDYGRIKYLLTTRVHRAVTRHDTVECFRLLRLLAKDTSIDPYILFRVIMILIESNKPEIVDKNATVYLESQLNKLETLSKPEVFVDFLSHFMKYNYLDYFNEIFSRRQRYMHLTIHRQLPYIEKNINCYEFLYNYINWQSKDKVEFDISIQGWLVNLMESLQLVQGNYEYFIMCLLDVLLYYNYDRKAYLYMSQYFRDNPRNLSAQLLMYKLLVYLSSKTHEDDDLTEIVDIDSLERRRVKDLGKINNFRSNPKGESFPKNRYPISQDREIILSNMRLLDPTKNELIELAQSTDSINIDQVDSLEILMDGLEFEHEITNLERWEKIRKLLVDIMEADLDLTGDTVLKLVKLWRTKYSRYWTIVDFVEIFKDKSTQKVDCQVIQDVIDLLEGFNAYGSGGDGDPADVCNDNVEF